MSRRSAPARTVTVPAATTVKGPAAPAPAAATSFGPAPGNAWTLQGQALSLLRRAARPVPVRVPLKRLPKPAAPGPDELTFDLSRSALVVVDMQNDFCHPRGWFGQKGVPVASMRRPIPVLRRLLPAWRAAGGRVLWLNWGVRPDVANLPPTVLFKGKRQAAAVGYAERSPEDRGRALVAGDWGAAVVDELPVDVRDLTVFKHRLSGFWDNELDALLRQQGLTTLLWAGINTDRCVFSSLQDAGFLGYDNLLVADACATPSPAYVTRAIHFLVQQLHGFVIDSAPLVAALPPSAPPIRRTRKENPA